MSGKDFTLTNKKDLVYSRVKSFGPAEGKIKLGKADVYIHMKGKSGARVTHIDIELEELNKILKPGEASYVQAKEGGVFIGLKKEMIDRAEKLAENK